MRQNLPRRNREKTIAKMATVFHEKLKSLSPESREILLDDMVTAFESRLAILSRARFEIKSCIGLTNAVEVESV